MSTDTPVAHETAAEEDDLARFVCTHRAGETIFARGDFGAELFIVESGEVELLTPGPDGVDTRRASLTAGETFGERALLDEQARELTARAVTDCRLLRLDYATLVELIREKPLIGVHLLRRQVRRVRWLDDARGAGSTASAGASRGDAGCAAAPHAAGQAGEAARVPSSDAAPDAAVPAAAFHGAAFEAAASDAAVLDDAAPDRAAHAGAGAGASGRAGTHSQGHAPAPVSGEAAALASAPSAPAAVVSPASARGANVAAARRGQFVHKSSGHQFPLPDEGAAIVGRIDRATGLAPEVDFTAIDPQRTLSRRHARVERAVEGFQLSEEPGVSNGTFVNDRRLAAGRTVTLRDGDRVRFGMVEILFQWS